MLAPFFGGRLRPDRVATDWPGHLQALDALARAAGRSARPTTSADPAALDRLLEGLDDRALLALLVHQSRLRQATRTREVATALRRAPFVDWPTPWDAGGVERLADEALTEARRRGHGDPAAAGQALAELLADPAALAALVPGAEVAPERAWAALDDVDVAGPDAWLGYVRWALTLAGLRAHQRLRADQTGGSDDADLPASAWPDVPAGQLGERWRWDLRHEALTAPFVALDDVAGPAQDALLAAAGGLPLRPGEPIGAHQWVDAAELGLVELVAGLAVEVGAGPVPPGGLRWTHAPWRAVTVQVRVGHGVDVAALAHPPRGVQVLLPVDLSRPVPLQAWLVTAVRVLAGTLLVTIDDLTSHATEVLRRHATGGSVEPETAARWLLDRSEREGAFEPCGG